MRIFSEDAFQSKGSTQIPSGPWVAVGIHCQSEVDLCIVGGRRLGIGGIVPVADGGQNVIAVRRPATSRSLAGAVASAGANPANHNAKDGSGVAVGDKLVLQLYEACDALFSAGPRIPFEMEVRNVQCALGVANSSMIARIPFSGRRQATIFSTQPQGSDLGIIIRGVRYRVDVNNALLGVLAFIEAPVDIVSSTSFATTGDGLGLGKGIHVGGGADNQESFDELQVWGYGITALVTSVDISCKAFGESAL